MLRLLSSLLLVALASGCGQPFYNPSSRVVNGEEAVPHSWPWQVSLQYEMGGSFYHTCGGSLITPDWVLTAGHCIMPYLNYRVVLGEHEHGVEEGSEQVIPINAGELFVHPKCNSECVNCGNDIALVKLSRSAQLGDAVQLACLPPAGEILPNGAPCYISGWGRLSTNGPLPDKLQQALLPVVDYEHCSRWNWWGLSVKTTMVCAGGDIQARSLSSDTPQPRLLSPLQGDSGGPLNCPADNGTWQVHGVTSFVSSLGCNTLRKPTVFTRVSAFIDWIEETIANN
uniref:Chymotrypsin-like elastase family, member 3A n=1 Tax=Mus spicilegus TaxID=10103 RepID=A0A8C6MZF2_MUSSI